MKKLIDNVIAASDHYPGGNAGIATVMQYQHDVMGPAVDTLRKASLCAFSLKELVVLQRVIGAFVKTGEAHAKIQEGLAALMGAKLGGCKTCDHEDECDDRESKCNSLGSDTAIAKGVLDKIKKVSLLEEVEDICA